MAPFCCQVETSNQKCNSQSSTTKITWLQRARLLQGRQTKWHVYLPKLLLLCHCRCFLMKGWERFYCFDFRFCQKDTCCSSSILIDWLTFLFFLLFRELVLGLTCCKNKKGNAHLITLFMWWSSLSKKLCCVWAKLQGSYQPHCVYVMLKS